MAPKPSTDYREAKGEKSSYQSAFNLLMDRKYDQAKDAFRVFLTKYPRSRLADNAQYWLAEANYVTRNFDVAQTEFNKVIRVHPGSPKVSDAMLKIGYIQYEKKQWSAAKGTLNSVVQRYPNSTASQLAKKRLSKMRAQGH
jgi:tol-pal system protein YbgF